MTPFSPINYIRENKLRCMILGCVFACIMVCYIGGVYITNPMEMNKTNMLPTSRFVYISSQEYRDAGAVNLIKVIDSIKQADPEGLIYESFSPLSFSQMTVLSYEESSYSFGFQSEEDFEQFNQCMQLLPNGKTLKEGEIAITSSVAKRTGVSVGDRITRETEHVEFYDDDIESFTVAAILQADYFDSYCVTKSEGFSERLVTYVASSEEKALAMADLLNELDLQYEDIVNINTPAERQKNSSEFYQTYYLIFTAVILLVAVVLAITMNAILSGIYQKRRYEFAVYNAIGFRRSEITGKIAGEILLLNVIGLLAGTILMFIIIFVLNGLLLEPQGMHLFYYHPVALLATVLCDFFVVVPVILVQSVHMRKCNIGNY